MSSSLPSTAASTGRASTSGARAYEQVVAQIEEAIRRGDLALGAQLPGERELAEQFAVSRVVIREAMRNLDARGVVEVRHGSGTFVRGLPDQAISRSLTLSLRLEESSLSDLYFVRQALEVAAAPLAAQHATPEQVGAMRLCLSQMRELSAAGIHTVDDLRATSAKDFEFHGLIAAASGNVPLATLLDPILLLIDAARLQLLKTDAGFQRLVDRVGGLKLHEEHEGILTAIAVRDPVAAQHFMYHHLQQSIVTYRDLG